MNDFVSLNPIVPPAALKQVAAKKAEIVAGKFHPFSGPVKGNDGTTRVPAGKTLSDKEIDSINWYVEGVEGKVPGK
jgi:basic membrane protein A and related proteins